MQWYCICCLETDIMKNKFYFILFGITALLFVSCIKDYELSQDEQLVELQERYEHIVELAQSESCDDSSDWDYVALGVKPCGGPTDYVAYSQNIDTVKLFHMIKIYNVVQTNYNNQFNISSDCAETPEPTGVTCEDGVPTLIY